MGLVRAALALLAAGAAATASAACSRDIAVGISDLGYGAYFQKGQWRGIVPEMMAELSLRSGCLLRLKPRPRARVLLEWEQGQLDVITSTMQGDDRDRIGHFMPYAVTEPDLVVIGPNVPTTLDELRRRPELKVGIVRGVRLGRVLNGAVTEMLASRRAEYSPDFDNIAAKLSAGRLQAALIPSVIHAKMRRDNMLPVNAVTVHLPEVPSEPIGLYVNRNVPPQDVQLLQRHLDAMRREGWVKAAYARQVGEAEAKRLFRNEAR